MENESTHSWGIHRHPRDDCRATVSAKSYKVCFYNNCEASAHFMENESTQLGHSE